MLPIASSLTYLWSSLAPRRVLPAVKVASKVASVACLLAIALPASSQRPIKPPTQHALIIPESSRANPEDAGVRMHTNVRYRAGYTPDELPPFSGYGFDTPASLACIYGLAPHTQGCNPNVTIQDATGGSQSIAIVDPYDYPEAAADLAYFSQQFGLPFNPSKFHVVYATGTQPGDDPTGTSEFEASIDIEYSHAMAPNATIYLVEAASLSGSDLFPAVLVASNLVACGKTTTCPAGSKGQGQVSMSWGGLEFAQETELDSFFTTPNVVYVASSGDSPGVSYPCASPNVLCAGGTTNSRSLETGNLIAQIGWSEAGGGISAYEPIPKYQAKNPFIAGQLQGFRGVPDVSAVANPDTGVWVWNTYPVNGIGWFTTGGTSVAAPVLAGILNSTGNFAASTSAELTKLYGNSLLFLDGGGFTDITYGTCNFYASSYSLPGWDQCTGLGSPYHLK
jgi:kumamolisin